MKTLLRFSICFLLVAALVIASVVTSNSASRARFEEKLQALASYEDAKSRYQIRTPLIFSEIDFRNAQATKRLAAAEEYQASLIGKDATLNILLSAAVLLGVAFLIERLFGHHASEQKPRTLSHFL